MEPSQACLDLIKKSEGCRLSAYQDVAGVWTVGYGCTGTNIGPGTVWTQTTADNMLVIRAGQAGDQVSELVEVPLTQGQFDALVDFVYNLGVGSLRSSTLLKQLNAGFYAAVPDQLYHIDDDGIPHGWIYAGGKIQPGLIVRRQAEIDLWIQEQA